MALDSLIITKLAIARQLLSKAAMSAAEPGPIALGLGVSLSQDALELILRAAAEHHRIEFHKRVDFEELVRLVDQDGHHVPHQQRLFNLNRARAAFKHDGRLPDEGQAKAFVQFAQVAGEELCQSCLGVSLWSVTMVDLVPSTRIRNHLNAAAEHLAAGRFEASCNASAIAFALVLGGLDSNPWEFGSRRPGEQTERFRDGSRHTYYSERSQREAWRAKWPLR